MTKWQCNLLDSELDNVTSLPVFTQDTLNCVLKTNKAFTVWNDMGVSEKRKEKKSYGVEYPFKDT